MTTQLKFAAQFTDLVARGRKITTIRRDAVAVGEQLDLVADTPGTPSLLQAEVLYCNPILLGRSPAGSPVARVGHIHLTPEQLTDLATCDGFDSADQLLTWFETRHGIGAPAAHGGRDVFQGHYITWWPTP